MLVLQSESRFLPQEDDAPSTLPVGALIKGDLPQCLTVAEWCKHRPSECLTVTLTATDAAGGTLNVLRGTDVGLEMNKMICMNLTCVPAVNQNRS